MTSVYVVRHAIAEQRDAERWPDDSKRPLTKQGEERFRSAARGLMRVAPRVDSVLSSPYVRAWRTAEILNEEAGWPEPERCDALEAERAPDGALEVVRSRESVAVVGHEPFLSGFVSLLLGANFLGEPPRFSYLAFFFLGAGFMLIETKGITEMGLTFGNTWQVIGFVIASILVMAFFGNCLVFWLNIKRPFIPYLLLWATVATGWFVARSGGFASTPFGRIETVVILTCPLLFSGIIFSTILSSKGSICGMMAMNLFGAICGGLLEYNSMYFGFRWLYLAALVCYFLAFISGVVFTQQKDEPRTMTLL